MAVDAPRDSAQTLSSLAKQTRATTVAAAARSLEAVAGSRAKAAFAARALDAREQEP